jgi:hypothetical protein
VPRAGGIKEELFGERSRMKPEGFVGMGIVVAAGVGAWLGS